MRVLVTFSLLLSLAAIAPAQEPSAARDLFVTAGKSLVVDSPIVIQRVAVANEKLAEAIAVSPREVLVNGKEPGETSLIIWQQGGNRLIFDLNVRPIMSRIEAVQRELSKELAGQEVTLTVEGENVFLRGTVDDLTSVERAVTIASTLGKPVNLLHVKVPPTEGQILLKVKFANVDRAFSRDLGANVFSTGVLNTIGATATGQFTPPRVQTIGGATTQFTLTDFLNIFIFRPDLNLGATIRDLENKRLLQILAEPNVLAINGKQASFLAGGEFPFPVVQGGAAVGSVTIQFREFGVRLNFLPMITPRSTIRLQVTPEVSSLDFANGLIFQGFNIPAMNTRRVQTEIELESGQSFAIGGLLDNRMVETFNKIPGLAEIPLLGKIFRSRALSKNNTELLVMVTPELVRPIPADRPAPEIKMPQPFLEDAPQVPPRTPGMEVTGPVPVRPPKETIRYEELMESTKPSQGITPAFTPTPAMPAPPPMQPAESPAPAAPKPGGSPGR
jgi:pilus assembly protein CpaC